MIGWASGRSCPSLAAGVDAVSFGRSFVFHGRRGDCSGALVVVRSVLAPRRRGGLGPDDTVRGSDRPGTFRGVPGSELKSFRLSLGLPLTELMILA